MNKKIYFDDNYCYDMHNNDFIFIIWDYFYKHENGILSSENLETYDYIIEHFCDRMISNCSSINGYKLKKKVVIFIE